MNIVRIGSNILVNPENVGSISYNSVHNKTYVKTFNSVWEFNGDKCEEIALFLNASKLNLVEQAKAIIDEAQNLADEAIKFKETTQKLHEITKEQIKELKDKLTLLEVELAACREELEEARAK